MRGEEEEEAAEPLDQSVIPSASIQLLPSLLRRQRSVGVEGGRGVAVRALVRQLVVGEVADGGVRRRQDVHILRLAKQRTVLLFAVGGARKAGVSARGAVQVAAADHAPIASHSGALHVGTGRLGGGVRRPPHRVHHPLQRQVQRHLVHVVGGAGAADHGVRDAAAPCSAVAAAAAGPGRPSTSSSSSGLHLHGVRVELTRGEGRRIGVAPNHIWSNVAAVARQVVIRLRLRSLRRLLALVVGPVGALGR